MAEERATNPGTGATTTPGDPLAGIEAFIATVDALSDSLARSSAEISGGLHRLDVTADELLANHVSLRERILTLASAAESPGAAAAETMELLGNRAARALSGDDVAPLAPATDGLNNAVGQTREILASAATRLTEDGFSANARAVATLGADLDGLCSETARAALGTSATCQDLSRKLNAARQEVGAALSSAVLEAATPALAALDESLGTLQAFGSETLASIETLFSDAFGQLDRTLDDLLTSTDSIYGEWLAETEELTGEAERHLRTTIAGQINERAERVKQDAAARGAAALEETQLDVEPVQTSAPKLAALIPRIVAAKQACLALAEVMGAMGL